MVGRPSPNKLTPLYTLMMLLSALHCTVADVIHSTVILMMVPANDLPGGGDVWPFEDLVDLLFVGGVIHVHQLICSAVIVPLFCVEYESILY